MKLKRSAGKRVRAIHHWATLLVSNGNNNLACNFQRFAKMTSKAEKLPMETEPVITTQVER